MGHYYIRHALHFILLSLTHSLSVTVSCRQRGGHGNDSAMNINPPCVCLMKTMILTIEMTEAERNDDSSLPISSVDTRVIATVSLLRSNESANHDDEYDAVFKQFFFAAVGCNRYPFQSCVLQLFPRRWIVFGSSRGHFCSKLPDFDCTSHVRHRIRPQVQQSSFLAGWLATL